MNETLDRCSENIRVMREEYSTKEFLSGQLQNYASSVQMAIVEQRIKHFMDKKEIVATFNKQDKFLGQMNSQFQSYALDSVVNRKFEEMKEY